MVSASFCDGVIQSRVCRGLPLSWWAAKSRSFWVSLDMSVVLGKYWRRSPLVFSPSLPRRPGVTEVDLDASVDGELGVLGHFFALIPGQRPPQVFG